MTVRIAVAASMILALVGCVRNPPTLETIDPGKATAVDLILLGGATSYCVHGDAPQLQAIVTLDTGKRLETWTSGTRAGKVGFDQFEWSSSPTTPVRTARLETAHTADSRAAAAAAAIAHRRQPMESTAATAAMAVTPATAAPAPR